MSFSKASGDADPFPAVQCPHRTERTWILALAISLFIHAAFAVTALTWWVSSPPGVALASGSGSEESEGGMPGDSAIISAVPPADLLPAEIPPDPSSPMKLDIPDVMTPGDSPWRIQNSTTALDLRTFDEHDARRIGVSGESLSPPHMEHSPPAGARNPGSPSLAGPSSAAENRPPVYPREALRRRIEGTVLLRVRVSAQGNVQDLHIDRSSGHDMLDAAALKAVRGWRFHPAKIRGETSACEVVVPVRFVLLDA